MNSKLKLIYSGVMLLLIQVILGGYVNIWPVLYIAIFPQLFILLPHSMDKGSMLVSAFILGLGVDFLSDGVLGLNAAALVAMAYFRTPVLKLVLSRANIENNDTIPLTYRYIELPKLFIIAFLCHLVFFIVYVSLDSAVSFTFGYTLLKITLCTAINSIISILCNIIVFEKIIR